MAQELEFSEVRMVATSRLTEILMSQLTAEWSKLKDDDENLIPLFECLTLITTAMKSSFPSPTPIFERCTNIIQNHLRQITLQSQRLQQSREVEPNHSFVVAALDLLSGLIQGLGMAMIPLLGMAMDLLIGCLRHPRMLVRQSAYALLGDIATRCFQPLRPYVESFIPDLTRQLALFSSMPVDNAVWSVGLVALGYGKDDPVFYNWAKQFIPLLISILSNPTAPHENAAISIGRIGLMHPTLVAPHLPQFAEAWCQALLEIPDNEEKDSAFRGFCTLVQTNPAGISKSLPSFCKSIVCWNEPSIELNGMFQTIVEGFKRHPPWVEYLASFSPAVREALVERYGE